jgi:hypothetical protein
MASEASKSKRSEECSDVATELELKMPGTANPSHLKTASNKVWSLNAFVCVACALVRVERFLLDLIPFVPFARTHCLMQGRNNNSQKKAVQVGLVLVQCSAALVIASL